MPSIKDRRARFTKQLIKETYLTILKDKPANKITVADICTRGDLNRSTFYLHYHDIVHVLEEIEDDVYREWTNIIVNMSTADDIQTFCYESYLKLFEKESFRVVFMNSQPGGVYERIVKTSTECFSYAYSQAYRCRPQRAKASSVWECYNQLIIQDI